MAMADSTAIAIVSVCVAGTTTVVAPLLTGQLEARREERKSVRARTDRDVEELRALLDEAAQMLYDQVRGQILLEVAFSDPRDKLPSEARATIGDRRRGLGFSSSRLAVRLGRKHAVTSHFDDALSDLDKAIRLMDLIWDEGGPREDLAVDLEVRAARYWFAYEAYVDAAQELAGARLDPEGG